MVRTYAESGVDIDAKKRDVDALVSSLTYRRRGDGQPSGPAGGFAGLFAYGDRVMGLCTDSVGTKVLVAAEVGRWDTIGIDCVAMNVNDMITSGLEPIAFVDYLAVSAYDAGIAREIGRGLDRGAELANVSIVGGEIAVVPELVHGYDLAGTCFGEAAKDDVIDPTERVRVGDVIVGVASSGIHSNGLTLARRVVRDAGLHAGDDLPGSGATVGDALLEPTAIYVQGVLAASRGHEVHGMANITGGGLRNLLRLHDRVRFSIESPLPVPPVFQAIQALAGIEDAEMFQTFNMGMGYAVVCPESEAAGVAKALQPHRAAVVGRVTEGKGVVCPGLGLTYERY